MWLWQKMRNNKLDAINRHESTNTHVAFFARTLDEGDSREFVLLPKNKLSSFEDFASFREYVETELAIKAIQ